MADAVTTAGTSLVRVEGRRRLSASGIVWSADGLIVTSHHGVTRDEDIRVGLPSGEVVQAALVGRDPSTDIAILKADASGLSVPTWAEVDDLRVGNFVMAVGRPGKSPQATLGIVSAIGESWRTPAGGSVDHYLQTDVVMYPGFSGGPLIDVAGQVRGMTTSALVRGISIALPTTTLKRVASTLIEHGGIRYGYLGINAQPARLPDGMAAELKQETGLLVIGVVENGPAAQGGLVMGDTIVSFDGESTRHMDDLLALLMGERVGKSVKARILRGGSLSELTMTVGERTEEMNREEREHKGRRRMRWHGHWGE
jgi:S1-C subfamily serine protease